MQRWPDLPGILPPGPVPDPETAARTTATPGCSDFNCRDFICFVDSICCDDEWDQNCADLALGLCGPDACRSACPGSGDCCQANGTPGCQSESCCGLVCAQDSFCCDNHWDDGCVAAAVNLCGKLCACPLFGDFNQDGKVDLVDFARFQNCFTGSQDAPLTIELRMRGRERRSSRRSERLCGVPSLARSAIMIGRVHL